MAEPLLQPREDSAGLPWRAEVYLFGAALLLAAGLRLYHLSDFGGLWMDELWTLMDACARGSPVFDLPSGTVQERAVRWTDIGPEPWWRIWVTMKESVHPPLFTILLRLWANVFGTSALALRVPNVVMSLGTLVVMYVLTRRAFGVRAGLAAAVIFAGAAGPVFFAQECRNYMLLTLATAGLGWVVLEIRVKGVSRGRLVGLGAALFVGFLSHYFFAGPAAGMFVYLMATSRGRARWQLLGTAAVAGAVYCVVWGPILLQQRHYWAYASHLYDRERGWWVVPMRALAAPMRSLLPASTAGNPGLWVSGVVLVVWPVVMARRTPLLMLPWAWMVGGVGFAMCVDLSRHAMSLDVPRYTTNISPAVCILIASMLASVAVRPMARFLPAAVVVGFTFAATWRYVYLPKGGYRDLSTWMSLQIAEGDMIVYHSDVEKDWRSAAMYFCLTHYPSRVGDVPQVLLTGTEPIPAETMARLRGAKRLWVVTRRPSYAPAVPTLPFAEVENIPVYLPASSEIPRSIRILMPGR